LREGVAALGLATSREGEGAATARVVGTRRWREAVAA
jgi:hypothetical protein